MAKHLPHDNHDKNQAQHPAFMEILRGKKPLEKILDERNLDHRSQALWNLRFEKSKTDENPLVLVAIDILGIVIISVSS